jgi:hypothetical protein
MELTTRQLNRTLLARQLLLARRRVPLPASVSRLVALQAQYAPSPYVALWSRLDGFRREQLTRALERGTLLKAWPLRSTLHVVARKEFPFLVSASIESQQGRLRNLGTDVDAVATALGNDPLTAAETNAVGADVLGTDDRWTIAFTLRGIPFVRTPPVGPWPHTKPSPAKVWREPLPPPDEATRRVVHAYLAAYGPATREDVEQFTGFRLGQIGPALDGLPRREAEDGRALFDVPRARLADERVDAPVRFLPPYDSIILAHRDRSRILPDAYFDTVIRRKNATTLATFTVDGFIAGSWRIETVRGRATILLQAFDPLPRAAHPLLRGEAERLVRFHEPDATAYAVAFR